MIRLKIKLIDKSWHKAVFEEFNTAAEVRKFFNSAASFITVGKKKIINTSHIIRMKIIKGK